MYSIKPIETCYNGYRFRSRLEARWAVFMDALGIEYQYEPEGFDLGEGLYYLPDFYLPKTNAWMEIKGKNATDKELEKMFRFCDAKCDFVNGGSKFRLLEGDIPGDLDVCGNFAGIPCYNYMSADECMTMKRIKTRNGILYKSIWIPSEDEDELMFGLLRAKQARFEHGECG